MVHKNELIEIALRKTFFNRAHCLNVIYDYSKYLFYYEMVKNVKATRRLKLYHFYERIIVHIIKNYYNSDVYLYIVKIENNFKK